jgi:tetratricopeptide (TPR) repeat protein
MDTEVFSMPRMNLIAVAFVFLLCLASPSVATENETKNSLPLYKGLGNHSREITTSSPLAQKYFDQGLAYLYAFNHDEAMRAFRQAIKLDPACAMAYWGLAISQGPHINNPIIPPTNLTEAVAALEKAKANVGKCTPTEQGLIAAAVTRYQDPQPEDRVPLDEAYSKAMGKLYKQFPNDADVGALYAESLLDLHPWDLWTVDGKSKDWTPRILEVLESVIEQSDQHPLALHLYIHACEASDNPGKADTAADRLRTLAPGLGHLVHMPSHIDIRRGRWQEAIVANDLAIKADAAYAASMPQQEFYRLYMTHNYHMLGFAAMMQGENQKAIEITRQMLAAVPQSWLAVEGNPAIVDVFYAMPYEVLMRFGRWEELLAEPAPDERFPIATTMHHFARAVAWGAIGKLNEARAEQAEFHKSAAAVSPDARFGNNKPADVFAVATDVLEGELLLREGKEEPGLAALRRGVEKEDKLRYDEPPDWIQPARHALGAALVVAKKYSEAEAAYREDLRRWPENGWSLFGLAEALAAQGKSDEAAKVRQRFDEAWKHADTKLTASCFCQSKESAAAK